jgi:thiamine biosynthesis lipoprotein
MIEPRPGARADVRGCPLRRFAHDAMACTFEVWLAEQDAAYAEQAARAAFAEADRLEQELSRFVPTSDVARLNALEPGQRIRAGIETIGCLQLAARLYDETGGAFDITFSSRSPATPNRGEPPLELDPKGRYVGLRSEGVCVDLGGVGKGYAVDQMVTILRDWSIETGLVHCGQSTAFALGRPADAEGWPIAIRDPREPDQTLGIVRISAAALSGSGRKLHGNHIIDPRRGRAVEDKLGSWALAPSAALSDALATAFMVLSPHEIEAYCRRHADVSAMLSLQEATERRQINFGVGLALSQE